MTILSKMSIYDNVLDVDINSKVYTLHPTKQDRLTLYRQTLEAEIKAEATAKQYRNIQNIIIAFTFLLTVPNIIYLRKQTNLQEEQLLLQTKQFQLEDSLRRTKTPIPHTLHVDSAQTHPQTQDTSIAKRN